MNRTATLTSLFLLAMLGLSVFSMVVGQSANALSAVSFTTKTTVNSVNPQFQQVYEDGTSNVYFLDTNTTYVQQTNYNVGSGTATTGAVRPTYTTSTSTSQATNNVYSSPIESDRTFFAVGRNDTSGKNIYDKYNVTTLTRISNTTQSSSYRPYDIVQSTSKLYSVLYNGATQYGILYLGNMARAYTGYAEPTLLTGASGSATAADMAISSATGDYLPLCNVSCHSVVAESFSASAVMNAKPFSSLSLSLYKLGLPTGTATVGTFDSSGNVVKTFGTIDVSTLTTSPADYYFSIADYTVQTGDRIGIKFTGGDGTNYVKVSKSTTNVYDGTNAVDTYYDSGWTAETTTDIGFSLRWVNLKTVVYDGSPDTSYTFFESGTNSIRVVKYTNTASLLGTTLSHTTGQPFSVVQLTDRIIIQTATTTYQLLTSSDAITTVTAGTYLTRYLQPYTISAGGRTFNSNAEYFATSTIATNYTPNTGDSSATGVLIQATTAPTLTVYAPAKYYYATTNNLTIEASSSTATSWTIKAISGSMNNHIVTPYSESLSVSPTLNSGLFSSGVLHLVCDSGVYTVAVGQFQTGNDTDCSLWRVTPSSSTTVGRQIFPYARTQDLVHTSTMTAYTFTLSQGDPTVYRLISKYYGKTIDVADFDSSGQATQYYLFGQCYDISVQNIDTGSSILFGNICANDQTTKPMSLASINIPGNWLGVTWFHNATRDYTDGNNNLIRFDVMKEQVPYNVSIHVVDNIKEAYMTYNQWFNYTNVSNMTTLVLNGFHSNQTLYITAYDGNTAVVSDILGAKSYQIPNVFAPLGNLFGVPLTATVIVGIAAIWRKENAYFGIVVTLATAGILFTLGMFSIDPAVWSVIIVLGAVGIMYGVKRN